MEIVKETEIVWREENVGPSTIPPLLLEETTELTTVIIFVISALVAITLLFIVAIFIDCRQEKLIQLHRQKRKTIKPTREDKLTIIDKMHQSDEATSSYMIV